MPKLKKKTSTQTRKAPTRRKSPSSSCSLTSVTKFSCHSDFEDLRTAYERIIKSQDPEKKTRFFQLIKEFATIDDNDCNVKTSLDKARSADSMPEQALNDTLHDQRHSADRSNTLLGGLIDDARGSTTRDSETLPGNTLRAAYQEEDTTPSALEAIIESYLRSASTSEEDELASSSFHHRARHIISVVVGALEPSSMPSQFTVGSGTGWLAGVLFMKISKVAAFILGAGLLTLQLAHYSEYVQIDWGRIHRDLAGRGRQYVRRSRTSPDANVSSALDFMERNRHVSMGFIGGFLLGVAMS